MTGFITVSSCRREKKSNIRRNMGCYDRGDHFFPRRSQRHLSLAKVDVSKIWNLDEGPHPVGGGGTRLLCRAHAHSSGSGCKQVGGVNTY